MTDQSEIDELRDELRQLRREVARLHATANAAGERGEHHHHEVEDGRGGPRQRRDLLKLAGAAMAAGAAGALASSSPAAAGASDIAFGEIKEYTGSQTVARRLAGSSPGDHGFMFQVEGSDAGFASEYPSALAGWSSDSDRKHGVFGRSMLLDGHGVIGKGGGFGGGVLGEGGAFGVRGDGNFVGVRGSGNQVGVAAESDEVGIAVIGTRTQFRITPNGTTSPPDRTSTPHFAGDLLLSGDPAGSTAQLWSCIEDGTPGTWRKLAGPDTAGSFHPVEPTRVYDSREPLPQPGVLTADTDRVVDVADGRAIEGGAVTDPDLVPDGATAIAVNITVTATAGGGFLAVTPGDASTFKASTVNWASAGQTIANAAIVKLDTNRQVKVFCGGVAAATHFVLDVAGYYL